MGLGSFCSQLEKLGRHPALRRPRPAGEIRVLCMHHALYFQRKAYLSILPESRARLRKFLIDHQISIILSGHIHETIFAHYRTPGPAGEWMTLESSAGTATRDTAAYRRWMESLGIACLNQLVVHTVEVSDGRLSWRAEDYHYRARAGFVPSRLRDDDPHAVRAIDLP